MFEFINIRNEKVAVHAKDIKGIEEYSTSGFPNAVAIVVFYNGDRILSTISYEKMKKELEEELKII
jgi:hypothetical protein